MRRMARQTVLIQHGSDEGGDEYFPFFAPCAFRLIGCWISV